MGSNGASNGKGNGKKPGSDAPPAKEGKAPNGKAKAVPAPEKAEPEESAAPAKGQASVEKAEAAEESDPAPAAPAKGQAAPAKDDAAPRGAAWAHPLARFDQKWTWLESRLLTFVLIWQILALCAWVFLNGLTESVTATAGAVFRAVILAVVAALCARRATREQPEERRTNLTLVSIVAAIAVTMVWRGLAGSPGAAASLDRGVVGYFDNIKGWLQEGSTLTLLGGLRGLGTRLTLWLALLGGSLATASGKHIHVNVVFRFIPKKLRMPVTILNYLFAATVCFLGVWGFYDHIAIEAYGSRAEDPAAQKIENGLHHIGNHLFFTQKQIGLDLRSMPHVLSGERYDTWMTAAAWNEWVDGAGFESRFEPEKVKNLHIPEGTHPPFVVSPDGEATRAALAHTLGLVFPFGLLAIGLRFLLRALLTLSGHYEADPDEAHKEEIGGRNEPAAEGGAQ